MFTFSGLPHEVLAGLEQSFEASPEPLARLEEVFDHLAGLGGSDERGTLVGTLDLPREFDEKQPEITGDVGHGGGGAVVEGSPVVDPFAQGVCVKDRAEQQDGGLLGIPVLDAVAWRDVVVDGVCLGGPRGRLWRGRLGVMAVGGRVVGRRFGLGGAVALGVRVVGRRVSWAGEGGSTTSARAFGGV